MTYSVQDECVDCKTRMIEQPNDTIGCPNPACFLFCGQEVEDNLEAVANQAPVTHNFVWDIEWPEDWWGDAVTKEAPDGKWYYNDQRIVLGLRIDGAQITLLDARYANGARMDDDHFAEVEWQFNDHNECDPGWMGDGPTPVGAICEQRTS